MSWPTNRIILYSRSMQPLGDLSLNDVMALSSHEEINGNHTLTIATTRVLEEGTRILIVDGTGKWREWVVDEPDQTHQSGDVPIGTYKACWSMQYDLTRTKGGELWASAEEGTNDPISATAALSVALTNSPLWTPGPVTVGTTGGTSLYDGSVWSYLSKLSNVWGGEFDAEITVGSSSVVTRRVKWLAHLGSSTATRRFDWLRDITRVHRTPDPGPYYCRVVPRGGNDATDPDGVSYSNRVGIEDETPNGEDYIEDTEQALNLRVPMANGEYFYPTKTVIYQLDTDGDTEELYAKALADLHNHTRPGVTYEADVLQLAEAGMDVKGVELGDVVHCVDHGFGDEPLRIEGRVVAIDTTYDLGDLGSNSVKLTIGQLAPTLVDEFRRMASDLHESTSAVSRRVTAIESDNSYVHVQNLVDQLNEAINALGGWSYEVPGEGIVTYDVAVSDPTIGDEATRITQIKGGTIRIATTKKPGFAGINDWNFKTVFDGDHIAADMITAVRITAGYIGRPDGAVYINLDEGVINFGAGATFGGTPVSTIMTDSANAVTTANDAAQKVDDTPIVTLSSTNGTVFKRNLGVSTTIIATVFTPGGLISDATELRRRYGSGAYLQWGWRDVVTDSDHWLVITDPRISQGGFALTVSPEDIDTQAVITCRLNA